MPHYQQSPDETFMSLESSAKGLSSQEAKARLEKFGPNSIKQEAGVSAWKIFASQFTSFLVLILLAAGLVSLAIGETIDALAILLIIVVNGVLGFFQEYRAEKAIEALKGMQSPSATVLRDGEPVLVDAADLVPGDVIRLEEGARVPADGRLIQVTRLEVDESLLTGESLPVRKQLEAITKDVVLADQTNMVFSSTVTTRGRAEAVITSTGMQTEVGKIAAAVQTGEAKQTPLQKAMDKIGRWLGIGAVALTIPGALVGVVTGKDPFEMFMIAVSLAVAAIPEGLPVVITIALAFGTKLLLNHKALVRRLPAVETLGSTDIICTDKTGTLTLNQMTVVKAAAFGQAEELVEIGSDATPELAAHQMLNKIALYCNDATEVQGDPTEIALVRYAYQTQPELKAAYQHVQRLDEIPFSAEEKMMVTLSREQGEGLPVLGMKGATEVVLGHCTHVLTEAGEVPLTDTMRQSILDQLDGFAKQALRVLGHAYQRTHDTRLDRVEGLVFVGLLGMIDPHREEVPDALAACKAAGVRVIMITGDHPTTAEAIAREIGFERTDAVPGAELEKLSEEEWQSIVNEKDIFARVTPAHKLKILTLLQNQGHIVAMTGDGVNDAAAIKQADIGIAVGSGTDLAKEVSDMILLNDNFATIRHAIEEGRHIFDNIKKFLRYLISANMGEIAVIFLSLLFGLPIVLLPIQILWINLATDSLPALALTRDVKNPHAMQRPPINPEKDIWRGMVQFTVFRVLLMVVGVLGVFLWFYEGEHTLEVARTAAFSAMVFFELFVVFSARSEVSAFELGLFSNKALVGSVILAAGLQVLAIYTPIGHAVLGTVALDPWHFALTAGAGLSGFAVTELLRYLHRYFSHSSN